jgi:hypothetical protein
MKLRVMCGVQKHIKSLRYETKEKPNIYTNIHLIFVALVASLRLCLKIKMKKV